MLPFTIKINLIPGLFLGLSVPKNPKQEFCQKILSAAVTSYEKSKTFNASIFYKTHRTHFEPFLVQKPQYKIFHEKSNSNQFSLYAAVTR